MSGYGFEIVQTLIVDIEPDAQVKRAMNEINAGKIHFFVCVFLYLISNICIYTCISLLFIVLSVHSICSISCLCFSPYLF